MYVYTCFQHSGGKKGTTGTVGYDMSVKGAWQMGHVAMPGYIILIASKPILLIFTS
jgi:hypothetical protein